VAGGVRSFQEMISSGGDLFWFFFGWLPKKNRLRLFCYLRNVGYLNKPYHKTTTFNNKMSQHPFK